MAREVGVTPGLFAFGCGYSYRAGIEKPDVPGQASPSAKERTYFFETAPRRKVEEYRGQGKLFSPGHPDFLGSAERMLQ